jgi:hypothetical protein
LPILIYDLQALELGTHEILRLAVTGADQEYTSFGPLMWIKLWEDFVRFRSPALAHVSYEGKEIGRKASPEARIDLQKKRLAPRDFVIHATKSFEFDRAQHPRKQVQMLAAMNGVEIRSVLPLDGRVTCKSIPDVQSFHDFAVDKQDVRGKFPASWHEFLAKVLLIVDAAKLRIFVVVIPDDVFESDRQANHGVHAIPQCNGQIELN